ncbi:MAG: hypothetical protein ACLFUT_13010 [Desulfobacteraceae bacterium]
MEEQQKPKTAVSIILGVFLAVVGLVFFGLAFSVLPGVGFLLAIPAIVFAVFFFVRAHRLRT